MRYLRTTTARALLSILAVLALAISLPLLLRAVAPEWWQSKHVYQYSGDEPADASDFAAANQGQLKNMAVAAYEHFIEIIPASIGIGDTTPGGTGWQLQELVKQWVEIDPTTGKVLRRVMNGGMPAEPEQYSITGTGRRKLAAAAAAHNDYTAINQGQLKAVASPFYERLNQLYAAHGGFPKPWTETQDDDTNHAMANIGQLKNIFSFAIAPHVVLDSDGDGMPDEWEALWNLDPVVGDANARIRGMGLTAAQMFAAGLLPNTGSVPAADDWTTIRRLNLYQDPEYTDVNGTWQPIHWEVPPGVTGTITIEREVVEDDWQVQSNSVQRLDENGDWVNLPDGNAIDVTIGSVRIPAGDRESSDYFGNITKRLAPALNEQYNHRLKGAVTSNESVVQVRLKVLTTGTRNRPRGIANFVSSDYISLDPENPARTFYKSLSDVTVEKGYAANRQVSQSTSTRELGYSASGFRIMNSNAGWWKQYDEDGILFHENSSAVSIQETQEIYQPQNDVPIPGYDPALDYSIIRVEGSSTDTVSNINANQTVWWSWILNDVTMAFEGTSNGTILAVTGSETDQSSEDPAMTNVFDLENLPSYERPLSPANSTYVDDYSVVEDGPTLTYSKTTVDGPQGSQSEITHTITLGGRYDTPDFIADSLAAMPAFLPADGGGTLGGTGGFRVAHATVVDGETWSERIVLPGVSEYQASGWESVSQIISRRNYDAEFGTSEFIKSTYWLECNDCRPGATMVIAEWSTKEGKEPTIVNSVTLSPGSDPGKPTRSATVDSDATSATENETRKLGRLPVDLSIDADRDGIIAQGETASQEKHLRFWINNDSDSGYVDQEDEGSIHDYQVPHLPNIRDLEDFQLLKVNVPQEIFLKIRFSEAKLGLKWKNITAAQPAINVYRVHDQIADAKDYLWSKEKAETQADAPNGDYFSEKANVTGTSIAWLPSNTLLKQGGINEQHPYLLFEGTAKGQGQLCPVLEIDGMVIECPGVWLKLMDVEEMFESAQGTVGGELASARAYPNPPSYSSQQPPQPPVGFQPISWPGRGHFEQDPEETDEVIVHVHGWRMTDPSRRTFSESFFKRLWWKGYKGRFATFAWPTYNDDQNAFGWIDQNALGWIHDGSGIPDHYNKSEYVGWKFGPALKLYVNSIPKSSKHLCAHSMGNIVAASALKLGLTVQSYVAMEAAIPAGCYDDATNNYPDFLNKEQTSPTPDSANPDFGYRLLMSGVTGAFHNFHSSNDFALKRGVQTIANIQKAVHWEANQLDYKPNHNLGYAHNPNPLVGQAKNILQLPGPDRYLRDVTDHHEVMSFIARPRSEALGARNVGGFNNFDMAAESHHYPFGRDRTEHSGQYQRPIQKTHIFFNTLLQRMDVGFNPLTDIQVGDAPQ